VDIQVGLAARCSSSATQICIQTHKQCGDWL